MNARVRRLSAALPAVLIVLALVACTGSPPAPSATPSAAATAAPATTPLPTPSPTVPPNAAPAALQGRWNTTISVGDAATLILSETNYKISRGGASGGGDISVDGDIIEFFGSNLCPDVVGTYEWAISTSVLTFTPVGKPDPCGRTDVLLSKLTRAPT